MNFKKGFKVRPSSINSSGAVLFTDGEVDGSGNIKNEFMPSEMACKALDIHTKMEYVLLLFHQ